MLKEGRQVLKVRDDPKEIVVDRTDPTEKQPFKLSADTKCSWMKPNEPFGPEKLRPRIEPWLTALVQSEHLSLLIGSGLTHAVHGIATSKALPGMSPAPFTVLSDKISAEVQRIAKAAQRRCGNFEDQISVVNELLRGLEIIATKKAQDCANKLREEQEIALKEFAFSILAGERGLASAQNRKGALNYLVNFLMSFASRAGTRERLHLFTTNYDRYIEAGADVAGLRLIDRFVGTLAPVFRSSRLNVDLHYNPPGIRGEPRYLEGVARFTKLHGSVDWVDYDGAIRRIGLPFGVQDINSFLNAPEIGNKSLRQLMIYPNAAKDRETTSYPYVELFRDFAAAICRPNSTLICYGYSFGDEHINRVIEDMLTIPSSHLVVIAYGDPLCRIKNTYNMLGHKSQITLMIGDHLGDLNALVDHYLPKPAIDRATIRMAELLKARWDVAHGESNMHGDDSAKDGNSKL